MSWQDVFGPNQTIDGTGSVSMDDKGHILVHILNRIKKTLWSLGMQRKLGCYSGYSTCYTQSIPKFSICPDASSLFPVVSFPPNKPDLLCGKLLLKEFHSMSSKRGHLSKELTLDSIPSLGDWGRVLPVSSEQGGKCYQCLIVVICWTENAWCYSQNTLLHTVGLQSATSPQGLRDKGEMERGLSVTAKKVTWEVLLAWASLLVLHNW